MFDTTPDSQVRSPGDPRLLSRNLPVFVWRTDPMGTFLYLDDHFLKWQGARLEDHSANADGSFNYVEAVHPEDREEALGRWSGSLRTGERYLSEHRMRGADGSYRWCRCDGVPMRDAGGRITGWHGTLIDIDNLAQVEGALIERERELTRLADTVPVLIWSTSAEGEPTFINRRLCEWAGIEMDDLRDTDRTALAVAVAATVHPDDAPAVGATLQRSFATGEPFAMRYRHRRADGTHHWVEGNAEPLRDAGGRILRWYGVSRDIEEEIRSREALRRANERIAHATQAASLSTLSASIAHEVNQPLAAIMANAQACQRWLERDPPNVGRVATIVARIVDDAQAGADVVNRVRALFQPGDHQRVPSQLNHLIDEVCAMFADELRAHEIEVALSLDPTLPIARLDRVQIQQLLANLVRNAAEAMEACQTDKRIEILTSHDGVAALAEVRDFGVGIRDPDGAFEPFVTTKQTGMGMGLAISRSIARAHGGDLRAEAAAPNGTRMIFSFPLSTEEM